MKTRRTGRLHLSAFTGKYGLDLHVLQQTYEYDPKARTWRLVETANDAPDEFWNDIVFGAMLYDPVNKEVLAGRCRWVFKKGKWEEQKFGSKLINGLLDSAKLRSLKTRALIGACRARFYVTESEKMRTVKLNESAETLAEDLVKLIKSLKVASLKASAYEKKQIARALKNVKSAESSLGKAAAKLGGEITPESIAIVQSAWESMDDVTENLASIPPGRAYFGLACDEKKGKIVLFGGHRLDRLTADTWVYDCKIRSWEQRFPKLSPSPRYGQGFVWLPKSGKFFLVDGVGIRNGQSWIYDLDSNKWKMLKEGVKKRFSLTTGTSPWGWQPEPSAALPDDTVVTLCNLHKKGLRFSTWAAKIDTTKIDEEGTAKYGVAPGTETFNGAPNYPAWYDQHAGKVETAPWKGNRSQFSGFPEDGGVNVR